MYYNFDLINDDLAIINYDNLENLKEDGGSRFYCINNMYLSGIQAGIQSAHSMMELVNKYLIQSERNSLAVDLLKKCIHHDKTMVVLNGGYQSNLARIYNLFQINNIKYPYSSFHEEEDALNGALTNISIVLPETVYMPEIKKILKLYLENCNGEPFSDKEIFKREIEFANNLYLDKTLNNPKLIKKSDKIKAGLNKIFGFSEKENGNFNFIILKDKILMLDINDFIILNEISKLKLMN